MGVSPQTARRGRRTPNLGAAPIEDAQISTMPSVLSRAGPRRGGREVGVVWTATRSRGPASSISTRAPKRSRRSSVWPVKPPRALGVQGPADPSLETGAVQSASASRPPERVDRGPGKAAVPGRSAVGFPGGAESRRASAGPRPAPARPPPGARRRRSRNRPPLASRHASRHTRSSPKTTGSGRRFTLSEASARAGDSRPDARGIAELMATRGRRVLLELGISRRHRQLAQLGDGTARCGAASARARAGAQSPP